MKTGALGKRESRPVSSLVVMPCGSRGRGFQGDSVSGYKNPGEEAQRAFTKETGGPCVGSKVFNRSCIITLGQDPSLPHLHILLTPSPRLRAEGVFLVRTLVKKAVLNLSERETEQLYMKQVFSRMFLPHCLVS